MSQSVSIVPSSGSGSGSLSHMRRSMRKVPLSTSKTGRASTRGEERRIVISSRQDFSLSNDAFLQKCQHALVPGVYSNC